MKLWAYHGGHQRWWRIRESAGDEDGDASRQSLGRKIDAEDEVKAARVGACAGFAKPKNTSRTKSRTDVANTGCAR
jgi:hypothetical protein